MDGNPSHTPMWDAGTARAYERVRHVIPEVEWAVHAPYVARINELKTARNAIVLAHNYQTPEIFHGIADYKGDSLGAGPQGSGNRCGDHYPLRRSFHGRDSQDLESRKARIDTGSRSGLLPGGLHHR